ncbi:hypothetical protein JMJ78_0000879 [Colletotrichum scovillei]|nr:hypothetical protein JMJ78_0000879 [Colletotrichum scovillei]
MGDHRSAGQGYRCNTVHDAEVEQRTACRYAAINHYFADHSCLPYGYPDVASGNSILVPAMAFASTTSTCGGTPPIHNPKGRLVAGFTFNPHQRTPASGSNSAYHVITLKRVT